MRQDRIVRSTEAHRHVATTSPGPDGPGGVVVALPRSQDGPQQFGVDLRGIVDVLSHHLYSSPRVYLRELLQNATDAVTERERLEPGRVGSVDVVPARDGAPLVVRDDGIGLTADEMRTLLATIGGTGKNGDVAGARSRLLGQFGIGLLSAFLVADTVEVRSRSAKDPDAETILWSGSSAGTFTITVADEPLAAPGTEVRVHPRDEHAHWCDPATTLRLATDVAEHLTTAVRVDGVLVSTVTPPWDLPVDDQLAWCRERLGFDPLGIVPLDSALHDVRGVGFVLPYTAMPGHRTGDRLYSRGMLVADSDSHVLPGWAFFCRAVIEGGDLALTASREAFQETPALELVRSRLGQVLIAELILVQAMHPEAYEEVMRLHADGLKALALESQDMHDLLRSTMPFRTTLGDRTLDGLADAGDEVRFVTDAGLYGALADLARTSGTLLLDASGPHDAGMIAVFDPDGRLFREVTATDVAEVADPTPADDSAAAVRLAARAAAVVGAGVQVEVAALPLARRPALWWPHSAPSDGPDGRSGGSTLLLNVHNDAVRALLDAPDGLDVGDAVRSLHALGMLQSHADLGPEGLQTLADSLGRLVREWTDCRG